MKSPYGSDEQIISDYSSKIKDVYLELDNYKFFHSPYGYDKGDKRFIGRRKIVNHLKTLLAESETKSGAYLITGFRGMGKTSVVRKAIGELNQKNTIEENKSKSHSIENERTDKPWVIILGIIFGLALLYFILIQFLPFSWPSIGFIPKANSSDLFNLPNDILARLLYCLVAWLISYPLFALIFESIFFPKKTKSKTKPPFKSFEINLSQDSVSEIDILKQVARRLLEYWNDEFEQRKVVERRKLYFFYNLLYRFIRKGFMPTSKMAIKVKLINLNNRINSQVSYQNEVKASGNVMVMSDLIRGTFPFSNLQRKNSLNYPIASPKEIEQDLIEALRDIDDLRKHNKLDHNTKEKSRKVFIPQFIFIIDELDKVGPYSSSSILDRESADPYFDSPDHSSNSQVRSRQEAVAKLLANLKGFLNIAMAKFIFIGGREMYDASLADIADRDSFYSSIFNDVIYVNSFLKDKVGRRAGITRMTEAYLVGLLIPNSFIVDNHTEILEALKIEKSPNLLFKDSQNQGLIKEESGYQNLDDLQKEVYYSLKVYSIYLAHILINGSSLKESLMVIERGGRNDVRIVKLMKVMFLLQNYIIHLTYRSNGVPKKLSNLIETLIVPGDDFFLSKKNDYLIVENNNKASREKAQVGNRTRLFLRFNYGSQYEIGLTSDLYRPYIIGTSRFLKSLGDKILFSSAFILDHLLKFHSFAFAWKNLELIPEVILVNKEPNLRLYINQLLNYLQEGYVRNTLSSIFEYKFNSIISMELQYLAKISELGSAAFNFTLDESLQIKRHYKRKLKELELKYKDFKPIEEDNQFVHSISFIQSILGDLHYYDCEYDEALIFYNEAIQSLRLPNYDKLTKHQYFLWIQKKLKAALTLERIDAYDSAYIYYRTLTTSIAEKITQDRDKLKSGDKKGKNLLLGMEIKHADGNGVDNNSYQYLQLIYTPIVALLALLEKYRFDGFTYIDLMKCESEVDYLLGIKHKPYSIKLEVQKEIHTGTNQAQQLRIFTLKADFLNNTGNLLFYKNKLFLDSYLGKKGQLRDFPEVKKVIKHFVERLNSSDRDTNLKLQDYRPSVYAYIYYRRALSVIIDSFESNNWCITYNSEEDQEKEMFLLEKCYALCEPANLHLTNAYKKLYVGNVLSNLGDTLLAIITDPKSKFDPDTLDMMKGDEIKFKTAIRDVEYEISKGDFSIRAVLTIYQLSSRFFRKANRLHAYSFQLRKILYVFKDYIGFYGPERINHPIFSQPNTLIGQCEEIAMEVVRALAWNNNIANRPQILKYRDILNIPVQERHIRLTDIMENVAGMRSVKETIILVESIRLKLMKGNFSRPSLNFISSYSTTSNKAIRMYELKYISDFYYNVFRSGFKSKKEKKIFKELFEVRFSYSQEGTYNDSVLKKYLDRILNAMQYCKEPIFDNTIEDEEKILSFIITEAISCKNEILKIIYIFNPGYIASFTYLANAHYKLARWCRFLENMYVINKRLYNDIMKAIGKKIGEHDLIYLESNHHFEQAIQNNYKAIQLHSEGKAYRNETRTHHFLEDDYNDRLKHFSAASERYRINLGKVRDRIEETRKMSNDMSKLYMYEYHYPRDKGNQ